MTTATENPTQTAPAGYDEGRAQAFAERIGAALDAGAAAILLAIGHRTGLLDVMARLPPRSSAEISDAAGLSERYVREWLSGMATAGIVLYDPRLQRYELPPEHAACLTRGAPLGNLAVYAQFVGMAGQVQERILQCFRTGKGTRFEEYPGFHAIMAEDSGQTVVAPLFDTLDRLVPDVVTRLGEGIDVLDAGCGSGRALVALAGRFPASRFLGLDLCPDAIGSGRNAAREAGAANARFEVCDLSGLDAETAFDLITSFDAVHDTKDPQQLLRTLHRALRPGGVHLMQDIAGSAALENNLDFPFATFLFTVSCLHCIPVSLGQDGKGLGTMWGWETAERMLREAGFDSVERTVLEHDPMNVWFVSRKE